MLKFLARKLTAAGFVYDLVQDWAGGRRVYEEFRDMLPEGRGLVVLDAGAGTGRLRRLFDPSQRYVALELDFARVSGLQADGSAFRVVGDVRDLPFAARSADVVCCVFVAHHLDDGELRRTLGNIARVTRGSLVLIDPIWVQGRIVSRVLWRYDQGAHPRTREAIRAAILEHFIIDEERGFSVLHQYGAWRCRPRADSR